MAVSTHRPTGQELHELIRQVQLGWSLFSGRNLTDQGVTLRQFAILAALVRQSRLKMNEIAQLLHVSLPAVTQLIDQMQKKRLVRRLPHPEDRRATWIEMTPAGAKVAANTQGRALNLLTKILTRFSIKDKEIAVQFLNQMRETLEKDNQGDS